MSGPLLEALRKYTNSDPTTPEGPMLPGTHFISKSAPDIGQNDKRPPGPRAPMNPLLHLAFPACSNQDRAAGAEKAETQTKASHVGRSQESPPPQGALLLDVK